MLDYAIKYETMLKDEFMNTLGNEKFKYYRSGYTEFDFNLATSDWLCTEMVSISNNTLNGFISADIDRYTNSISALKLVSFDNNSFIFGIDIYKFMKLLLKRFDKINFSVNCGNPAENKYDKLVANCGGRIVGIYKNHVRLVTGDLCDQKVYEIIK